ncbi:MAG: rod shape-determining protein MreD [Bacteroidales bacterium]|nr:rod shape-determining protein MreD [Bacteroidales bacterium]
MDIRGYLKLLGAYFFLVLIQVLVFSNIKISEVGITPMFYVLFILIVPFEVPNWLQLVFAFILGYSIDVFADTPGLNAAATVVMAFARPGILNILSPRDGYESGLLPYVSYLGMNWFIKYSVTLIAIHHFVYFLINSIGFFDFYNLIINIFFTTICSSIFIILSQFFIFRK